MREQFSEAAVTSRSRRLCGFGHYTLWKLFWKNSILRGEKYFSRCWNGERKKQHMQIELAQCGLSLWSSTCMVGVVGVHWLPFFSQFTGSLWNYIEHPQYLPYRDNIIQLWLLLMVQHCVNYFSRSAAVVILKESKMQISGGQKWSDLKPSSCTNCNTVLQCRS